ncbi:MAG TPA: IPT/TIG domain-containing protein [Thermoanaerobaculia bacterium]|jgi:hypothetical protein|nr:IPT/TIG domain-containing protein [Thermoanaerobaculia bacterium]
MKMFRQRKFLFALLAMLVIFAGCKGESPTAPPPSTGGGSTPGGGTPATGTVITVTFSNTSPVVGSPVTVSAAVTQNNTSVPNGTAVELTTSLGTFSDTGTASTIRTTTNGVATAILNATTPGTATVVATINNVAKSGTVTFRAAATTPTPTPTNPTITGVTPTFGKPSGGETVTINGTNFTQPVRVFFDFGNNTAPVEAFVLPDSTSTQLRVLSPKVDLGAGQTKPATIIVITQAGSATEQRATSQPFTFVAEQLTPVPQSISPSSGPITGGTRVTIFGSGFQAPVQVQFGDLSVPAWQDAQVISVTFNQIVAITPDARSTSPNGGIPVTGPVDLRVNNIASGISATVDNIFRFTPKMQITSVSPQLGSSLGGTDVTIDGIGFEDPVTVTLAGVQAQVLRVSGSQLLVRSGALGQPCGGSTGPVSVTNVENGDVASTGIAPNFAGGFQYVGVSPTVTSATPNSTPLVPGNTINVTVLNPGVGPLGSANVRFTVGGQQTTATPNPITNGTGSQTFTVTVPTGLSFPSIACTTGGGQPGTQLGPTSFPIVFLNVTTGCTDTLGNAVTITPPGPNPCVGPATASASQASPACPAGPSVPAASGTAPITITVSNTASAGSGVLNVSGAITSGGANFVAINPSGTVTVAPGQSRVFTVTFDPSAPGVQNGTVTFTTNDPANPTIAVPICGTGTP